jgi:aspartokinase/homoserine dehydrogenase 1
MVDKCASSTGGYIHHKFVYIDARRVITIDEDAIQDGAVVWDTSSEKFMEIFQEEEQKLGSACDTTVLHFIITGYVAINTEGVAVTLKRDGSDYSAAIMGKLLQANSISIWTDVDGVLSADPRRVPLANVLPEVSYDEAMELAYFGAKVIHPKTMQPAISCDPQIPIYIRNTFNKRSPGTRIFTSATSTKQNDKVVCGFSSVEGMALVNVEGTGMIGIHGVDKRIFGVLEYHDVNVALISQAISEHSVTFATSEEQAELAKKVIKEEFRRELALSHISSIDICAPVSIIAAVGDGMVNASGVAGRFFSSLGGAKINVLAIAQGSSERNISAVVHGRDSTRALRAVHAGFNLSNITARVGIIGMSEVGISLLELLESERDALKSNFDLDVQVVYVCPKSDKEDILSLKNDSESGTQSITMGAVLRETADNPGQMKTTFADEDQVAVVSKGGLTKCYDTLFREECTFHCIFDCSSDEAAGHYHADWLRAGLDVITANNRGLSGPKSQREDIKQAEKVNGNEKGMYMRETVVAGALPIITTLRSLLHSGDKIRRIDGIFTVVKSYVMFRISPPPNVSSCSQFDVTSSNGVFDGDMKTPSGDFVGDPCSFSQAVREAVQLGLTEDDPTLDLNNNYAARVLMTLARELGMDEDNETEQIQMNSDTLVGIDQSLDFQNLPPQIDLAVQKRVDAAQAKGCVLRSIASIDVKTKSIQIRILEVPNQHAFAVSPPGCSCVRFFTRRHERYPLIIQGPSAGADSTASALLAELLQRTRGISTPRSLSLVRRGSSGVFLDIKHSASA